MLILFLWTHSSTQSLLWTMNDLLMSYPIFASSSETERQRLLLYRNVLAIALLIPSPHLCETRILSIVSRIVDQWCHGPIEVPEYRNLIFRREHRRPAAAPGTSPRAGEAEWRDLLWWFFADENENSLQALLKIPGFIDNLNHEVQLWLKESSG